MARTAVGALALALCSTSAFAQQQRQPAVGVVMGYPAAIGVLWNVSDRFALRPEVSVTRSTADSTTAGAAPIVSSLASSDTWSTGIGLSALWYFTSGDALRTYVSPRFAYSRATNTNSNTTTSGSSTITGTNAVSATYAGSGSIGAQYSLHRRFAVFGELGITYTDVETETTSSNSPAFVVDTTGKTISVRSGVGVIVFF
jgi:opacity protein-like surface antigen